MQYKRAATQSDQSSKSEEIKKGGLDALLGSLQQARKVNVLDKSRMDWGDFKSSDVKVNNKHRTRDACHMLQQLTCSSCFSGMHAALTILAHMVTALTQ